MQGYIDIGLSFMGSSRIWKDGRYVDSGAFIVIILAVCGFFALMKYLGKRNR